MFVELFLFLAEQNCTEVLGLDAVPRLVKLLSSPEKVVSVCAVITLAVMVSNCMSISIEQKLTIIIIIHPSHHSGSEKNVTEIRRHRSPIQNAQT